MEKLLIGILAMASVVVASNILVQFLLLDGLLTWGAFTYPIAFLITDLMNKSYGPRAARKIVLVGFIVIIIRGPPLALTIWMQSIISLKGYKTTFRVMIVTITFKYVSILVSFLLARSLLRGFSLYNSWTLQ